MDHKDEDIETKLKKLIESFIQEQLPLRIQGIIALLEELSQSGFNLVLLEKLLNQSHSLKGTSAVYKLPIISDLMEKIEDTIAARIQDRIIVPQEDKDLFKDFIQELVAAGKDPRGDDFAELQPVAPEVVQENRLGNSVPAEEGETGEDANPNKIVFLIEQDDFVSHDLIRQFSLYGYEAETVGNIEEMISSIRSRNDEVIVIIDTLFLENTEVDFSKLAGLKAEKENLVLAFVSRHGDFELRLKAVKAGADAYFVFPLDVGESIDKLNSLTTRNNPYHVLIVDDDPNLVAYYAHLLQQRNMITSVVSKPMEVVTQIILTKPELIMMDLNMPTCNGWELAKIIRQQEAFVSIPIVFLSSEKNIEKRYEALRNGGDDFISKSTPAAELIESIRIRAERYRTLRFYMERDSLTGLLNHTRLIEQLTAEINKAKRMKRTLSFAMIDLDHFKDVNDSYGHMIGDKVLKRLARLMKERLRSSDIIGRYGGEEFAVILPDTGATNAFNVIEEIRIKFAEMKHTAPTQSFIVTLSAGIATYSSFSDANSDGEQPEKVKELAIRITNTADQALYRAKELGRDRIINVDVTNSPIG